MNAQRVIIVGAGLGGLAAALHLAARGFQVCILEKNPTVGGKLNRIVAGGFSFDTGPSLVTLPDILRDTFAVAGARLEDYLTLQPLDPICRYRWPDGARLDLSSDLAKTIAELRRLAPEDEAAFFRFLSYGADLYTATAPVFLFNDFRDWRNLWRRLDGRLLRQLPRLATFKTVADRTAEFFTSPYLRQLFNRYATYNGSSPYRAQATFCLIPYVEFAFGAWYVAGGLYRIAEALAQVAQAGGVQIHTDTPVAEIVVEAGRTRGVRLAAGDFLPADAVISNADSLYTYARLLPGVRRRTYSDDRLARIEPSCSGFILLLGTARKFDALAHHNIFFSSDYPAEFADIFDRLTPPADPTIYVCATSRTDPTQAPPGSENLFVMVNAPAVCNAYDWDDIAPAYRNQIVARLEAAGLEGLARNIVFEDILTPKRFATWFNAHRGAIYGLSSNSLRNAFWRPPIRAREARGLYFAGGGTHPGGGIPLVLLSGKIAAAAVAADVGQASTSMC
ncbi:MAG: phytoene desaturase family protein [Chloracidobacterium sp.]|nr:phytoene desaturase family protein [Chloracidobacterium sp.]MDW8218131.1 phytoene desaturase family protein [Acidobacteriota bacterium]